MSQEPSNSEFSPLSARGVDQISKHAEYLRLSCEPDGIIETQDESKGSYVLGALYGAAHVLRVHGILVQHANRLVALAAKLATRVPGDDGVARLTAEDAKELEATIVPFRRAWSEFLSANDFIHTRPARGLFNYDRLQSRGSRVVFQDTGLLARLPPTVVGDIDRATRALARGVTTASVILTLRAGEAMLAEIYRVRLNKEPDPTANQYTLAQHILPHLTMSAAAKDELEGLVNTLRTVRNKAMRPGTQFGVSEAEDVLVAVRQLIVKLDGVSKPGPADR